MKCFRKETEGTPSTLESAPPPAPVDLANAVQYSADGGIIALKAWAQNGSAFLSVTDTGAGIAPEDLPHIFERFYRADRSRAHSEGRAGLGLAICRAICEAHGGRIEVRSEPGCGSTFTVSIPAAAGAR